MTPLQWARQQIRTFQHDVPEDSAKLYANELHKLTVTLARHDLDKLNAVAKALAGTRPKNPFADRSNDYADAFAYLRSKVVEHLPEDRVEAIRGLRLLERLLAMHQNEPALLAWI